MKTVILIITNLFISMNIVFAQGELKIKTPEIKWTNLKASSQAQTEMLQIENIGNQPILINRVVTTNPQFKAEWSREPLAPGKSAKINITFTSMKLTERFACKLTIHSNAKNSRAEAQISGNLVENPADIGLLYKFNMNGLRFKTSHIGFNRIYTWQVVSDTVYFVNTLPKAVVLGVQHKPAHLGVAFVPTEVEPGKKGTVIITFDAPKSNDFGYCYASLLLKFNDEKNYSNRLSVTANLVEDFSKLSKRDLTKAPIASFDKKEIIFGDLKKGEKSVCDFVLTNTGKMTLFIRKTKASCGCTAVALGEKALTAGESTTIRVTFDSTGKTGRQHQSVTVITNDPKTPETRLTISGNIK